MYNQVEFSCLCLAFSFLFRAGLDPSASPNEINISKAMSLQEIGDLDGAALELAEGKGLGPEDVDCMGWTLLHHSVVQPQHRRGMLEVVRGLLEVMPVEVVDQRVRQRDGRL